MGGKTPDARRIRALAYSPDGTHIATASHDKTARVWDAQSGEPIATLRGHADTVFALAYAPDGDGVAIDARDGEGNTALALAAKNRHER